MIAHMVVTNEIAALFLIQDRHFLSYFVSFPMPILLNRSHEEDGHKEAGRGLSKAKGKTF